MGFDPITAVLDVAGKVIDRVFPDPVQAANAKLEMMKLQQAGDFKQIEVDATNALAQVEVNKEEAKNTSLFVSGWRPAAGWLCVMGLGYMTLFRPIGSWIATLLHATAVPPVVDTTVLLELLLGMLGLGTLRTVEKLKK